MNDLDEVIEHEANGKRSLCGLGSFCSVTDAEAAETGIRIPLEKFGRSEEVALQRGESVANGACAINLVNELRVYAGEPTGWFITFDSGSAIIFESPADRNFRHVCVDGKQITYVKRKETVTQIYDEQGNPTIMEP